MARRSASTAKRATACSCTTRRSTFRSSCAGRPDRALPYFKRVADAGPRSADPLVGLATAYAQLDRMDDARAALERALALEPANGQAHYNLGEIARARGDAPGARAAYEAALRDPVTRDRAAARLQAIR